MLLSEGGEKSGSLVEKTPLFLLDLFQSLKTGD